MGRPIVASGLPHTRCSRRQEERFAAQARFVHFDLDSDFSRALLLPGEEPRYDAITAIEIIEHLENPAHFLRECATCLVPGGLLFVTSPNVENVPSRLQFLYDGHLRMFDPRGARSHITPITSFLLRRIVPTTGLTLLAQVPLLGFVCSRLAVRLVSQVLRPFLRGNVDGDCNLFLFTRS